MEKYILQILENNSRVIVPDFGAFIVKQKSPLTIVFNEFLQYNDGMLVDTVAKGEGIGRDAAKEKIDEFVKTIISSLDKKGSYPLNDLGILVKGSSGKISLDTTKTSTIKDKPKTKASTPPVEKTEKKIEKLEENKTLKPEKAKEIPASKRPIPALPKNKSIQKPEEKEAVKKTSPVMAKGTTKRAMVKPPTEESKTSAKKKEPAPPVIAEKVTKNTEQRKQSSEYSNFQKQVESSPQKEKKRGNKFLLWGIAIVLINACIVAYFYYNGYLDGLFGSNDDTEELLMPIIDDETPEEFESAPSMDPMIEEELIENEPVPVAPPVPIQKKAPEGRKYYIVAGVFGIESNANNLVEELKSKGFDAQKFGKIGNLFAVSYGVYSSKADANKALNEIKANENPQAWMKVVE